MPSNFRLEISFKTIEELKKKIEFCIDNDILNLNIPCKGNIKKAFLLDVVEFIGSNYKQLDVVYHYSCYHQYSKNIYNSYLELNNFLEKCSQYKIQEILLVSGSKKRKGFESIDVLNYLYSNQKYNINFGIAYNPYFRNELNVSEERKRLVAKLRSGLIQSLWIQFGSDLKCLSKELIFIKNELINYPQNRDCNVNIYGSLFIPSKQFLSRFKFRPWKFVFLSNQYLNSLDYAYQFTKDIIKQYSINDISPLIETKCSSQKDLKEIYNLLGNSSSLL